MAEFKEGIARQRVAALLEEYTPEVFETSVGNIPAQTTIKIEICYTTELKVDLGGDGILVTIPTSVAPRYGAPPGASLGFSKSLAVPPENGLQIQLQILLPVLISKIESRTHPVSVEMGSRGYTTTRNIRDLSHKQNPSSFDPRNAKATLSDRSACLGKDFVLLVQARDGQLLASRALLEQYPKTLNDSVLMISINLRDMYTPNVVALKESSEIIFLADRSGLMNDKMEVLKTAMRFFLKSLPNNCTFNICSFGDNYDLMWLESRPYNQENVDAALSYITMHFAANMGGTEILSGLRHVIQKSNSSVNTEIIVLTDGEVWDSESTFDFIRETRASGPKAKARFFALGIGEAVLHHLVEGIGRYGGGLAEVVSVSSAGDWKGRVIRMLEAALMPSTWKVEISLEGFSTTSTKEREQAYIQALHHIPDFYVFSRSLVYFILNQQPYAKTVKIKATASSGEEVAADLLIEILESRHRCVYLLAAKAVLRDLESGQSWLHDTNSNGNAGKIKTVIDDLARSEGEKIGTEWSILSKWTSFVVVDDNSLEKPSRWYRAEKSDLAELTRQRYGARNYSFRLLDQIGSLAPTNITNSKYPSRYSNNVALGGSTTLSEVVEKTRDTKIQYQEIQWYQETQQREEEQQEKKCRKLSIGFLKRKPSVPRNNAVLKQAGESLYSLDSLPISPQTMDYSSEKMVQIPEHTLNSRKSSIQEILDRLIDAQTAAGSFNLDSVLRTTLNDKFKYTMRKAVRDWFLRALGLRESVGNIVEVLDTALLIVWIEVRYAESQELWGLAVQKAKGFLKTIVLGEEHSEELFQILRGELLNSDDGGEDERRERNKVRDEVNMGDKVNEGDEGDRVKKGDEVNEVNEGDKVSGLTSVEQTLSARRIVWKFLTEFLSLGGEK